MGQDETGFGPYIGLELEEAIEAVAAARHCIHNLYRAWQTELSLNKEKQIRIHHLTTVTNTDANSWSARVVSLIGDRGEAVHHDEEFAPTQPHPGYPTNVSGTAALFTAERASLAVDVMLDDVIRPVLTAPVPALKQFADDNRNVLEQLDDQRANGDDLW